MSSSTIANSLKRGVAVATKSAQESLPLNYDSIASSLKRGAAVATKSAQNNLPLSYDAMANSLKRGAAVASESAQSNLPLSYGAVGAVGTLCLVWPLIDQEWKERRGLVVFKENTYTPQPVVPKGIQGIYVGSNNVHPEITQSERATLQMMSSGDYSLLEKEWEAFQIKACKPGDGDDDDDDEDEDDDDDEEDDDDDEEDDEDDEDDDEEDDE